MAKKFIPIKLSVGSQIRNLRVNSNMPLRKLAALLDIDQSTLSKIEKGKRVANSELIYNVAEIFKIDQKDLLIAHYSDIIATELNEENLYSEILEVAEAKIEYQRTQAKKTK